MKAPFGIFIIMGIVKLPSYKCYWQESEPIFYQASVANVTPRDRFETLLKYLHLNDNSTMPASTSFGWAKLQQALQSTTAYRQTFRDIPFGILSWSRAIDWRGNDQVASYKGRLGFVQYMPAKPVKRGVKVFCLCDAKTGYLVNFNVYAGKEDAAEENLTERCVTALLQDKYYGVDHFVYTDNWFTSIDLILRLKRSKVYTCGTLRKNRKHFP